MARKRFPPDDPREWLNRTQHQRAVRIAEAVVRWAERQIGKP